MKGQLSIYGIIALVIGLGFLIYFLSSGVEIEQPSAISDDFGIRDYVQQCFEDSMNEAVYWWYTEADLMTLPLLSENDDIIYWPIFFDKGVKIPSDLDSLMKSYSEKSIMNCMAQLDFPGTITPIDFYVEVNSDLSSVQSRLELPLRIDYGDQSLTIDAPYFYRVDSRVNLMHQIATNILTYVAEDPASIPIDYLIDASAAYNMEVSYSQTYNADGEYDGAAIIYNIVDTTRTIDSQYPRLTFVTVFS